MHLSALSAVFKEQPVEEHFLKKDNVRYDTILAEQSIDRSVTKKQVNAHDRHGQDDNSAGTLLCM